jgi:hypothetical protein
LNALRSRQVDSGHRRIFVLDVINDDVCAARSEKIDDSFSDATRASGNKRHPIRQT